MEPSSQSIPLLDNSESLPAGNPQFGLGFGKVKPVPLLALNLKIEEEEFYISEAAQNYLDALEGECYVISVSGNPLVGKSSLLNLLLSLFNMDASQEEIFYLDMYPVGDGKRSTTEGIDMYCISIDGKNLIFLDIEGDDDPNKKETGAWIYMNLLQNAVGMSHVHLYNYNGLAQKTFFSYFDSIQKMVKQNKLHPEFETKHFFLKRNDCSISKDTLDADLQENRDYLDKTLSQNNLNYSPYLLPMPPQHITKKKSEASCIVSTGLICKECQNHLFMLLLFDIKNELNSHMNEVSPFKSGHHLSKILEQLFVINQIEIPRFSDRGYISRVRLDKFRKEQNRIQASLSEVERYQAKNGLAKEVQKTLKAYPTLADEQFGEDFSKTRIYLEIKVSQMVYLIPELWMFVRQYLLDERASILNEMEKKSLYEAYIAPFGKILKEIITSFRKYDELVEFVYQNLMEIKIFVNNTLVKGMLGSLNKHAGSFQFLFLMTPMIVQYVGIGGLCFGAYYFVKIFKKQMAIMKKNAEIEDGRIITENKNLKLSGATREQLDKIEEFVTKLVSDFEMSTETLKKVCSDDESKNFNLVAKISNAMDDKMNGMNLSPEDRNQLVDKMNAAEKNLERFKRCL